MSETEHLTIEVQFPDGKRFVPAHFEGVNVGYNYYSKACPVDRLIPDSMEGWGFHEELGGKWYAYEVQLD